MFDKIIETSGKRLSIQITNRGEVILKKPKNYDQNLLNKFIESKISWINTHKEKIIENNKKNANIINMTTILIFGQEMALNLNSKKNKINQSSINAKNLKSLISLIKKFANEKILERASQLAQKLTVNPSKISIENTKRRWGVCNNKKEIKINFRAIMLNQECFDYIIIHELLHLKEFNHSQKFWNLVKKYVPNYTEIKKTLKDYGFLLEMYR